MGIRFACPNGHPLHVKADLAGKRGICPECQARFLIPQPVAVEDAPQLRAEAPATMAATATPQPVVPPAPVPPKLPAATTPPPAPSPEPPAAPEPPAWYIRPASGGQFGPADDTLIQQWAAEGRVGADSYVWRTGWPDWRLASELPEHFPHLGVAAAAPLLPSPEYNTPSTATVKTAPASDDSSLASARYRRRKLQAARGQQLLAVMLVCLTIALAGVLVWVIFRMNSPEPPATNPPTTPVPPAGAPAVEQPTDQATEGADDEAMEANPAE